MNGHIPVMPDEVIKYLVRKRVSGTPAGIYVDCTLGGGGHALELLKHTSPDGKVICLDVDEDALIEADALLKPYRDRVEVIRENYKNVRRAVLSLGIESVDGILFDLGASSYQLERPSRGFSFMREARLDMRMDRRLAKSAYELVNGLSAEELARIFRQYGEEKRGMALANAIVREREISPIVTTTELSRIIEDNTPHRLRHGRIHPSTRAFQALRIEVNKELENIELGLKQGIGLLKKGGRMVVISFHSLEDRIVKDTFREFSKGCVCPRDFPLCVCGIKPVVKVLTKKVVTPKAVEVRLNPRARSAKMRAIEKL